MARPLRPRAGVDLLCTLARKVGLSLWDDALAEALLDAPYEELLPLALAEPEAVGGPLPMVDPLELSIWPGPV